ncbi:MAG: universal stress protein [Phaeodactylibacter sp.]|uniref:universal stress protein n=1 Tax=Phaeodactylibacter sp. TaxID=1940289 RepID=UPI0032EE7B76
MRTILSPTDFSIYARYATDAAAQLARRLEAQLHLLHCINLPDDWSSWNEQQRAMHPDVEQKVTNAKLKLQELSNIYPDLEVKTTVCGSSLPKAVAEYVDQSAADLVVMGSHGASGKNEYFIGSNTQKVVREVHCPVLVIKEPVENLNFDKVVFASSFHQNERGAFLKFKEFVKPFVPEIHLVEIHTSSFFDPPYILSRQAMEEFKGLCAPFRCETHVFRNFSVDRGVRAFAEKIGAGLIGISNHYRHPLRRMLSGSNVEALVNHSDTPVLSIDYLDEQETPQPTEQKRQQLSF